MAFTGKILIPLVVTAAGSGLVVSTLEPIGVARLEADTLALMRSGVDSSTLPPENFSEGERDADQIPHQTYDFSGYYNPQAPFVASSSDVPGLQFTVEIENPQASSDSQALVVSPVHVGHSSVDNWSDY